MQRVRVNEDWLILSNQHPKTVLVAQPADISLVDPVDIDDSSLPMQGLKSGKVMSAGFPYCSLGSNGGFGSLIREP